MKFAMSALSAALALAGAVCAGEPVSGTGHYVGDEIPFVEGQPAPAAPSGYAWCLEKRKAVMRTVKEQVKVRDETSYYETVPPQYESRMEQVLVEPEQKRAVLVAPAVYRDVPEQRMVQPASVDYRTVPAQYEWVEEQVEVVPERVEKEFVPARYEEYTEQVQIHPERTIREEVPGCDKDGSKIDCYGSRTIPAEYQTVTKKRLVAPATTQTKVIPAERKLMRVQKVVSPARVEKMDIPAKYETITKKVLDRPAEYRYETIPARYSTVEKKVITAPEGKRLVRIPAKYETVSRIEVVSPERLVWVLKDNRNIACPLPEDRVDTRVEAASPTTRPAPRGSATASPSVNTDADGSSVDDLVKRYGRVPGTAAGR